MLRFALWSTAFFLLTPFCVFADPGPAPTPATWQDKWVTDGESDSSTLTIRNSDKTGFAFSLVATSGANVGELEGNAVWTSPFEDAKASVDGCKLIFGLFKNQLEIKAEDCDQAAGVSFDGTYRRDSNRPTFKTSYECRGDLNPVEDEICSVRWLAAADLELATAFNSLLDTDPSSPAEAALKKEQNTWIRERDKKCKKDSRKAHCIGRFYADRIAQLRAKKSGKKSVEVGTFENYVKLPPDDAATALKNDAFIALLIRLALPEDTADLFFSHNIVSSGEGQKIKGPRTEIAVFSQIRGIPGTAGLVLTQSGGLWVLVSTIENAKHRPWVYGPKSAQKKPAAVENWLRDQKGKDWLAAKQESVF